MDQALQVPIHRRKSALSFGSNSYKQILPPSLRVTAARQMAVTEMKRVSRSIYRRSYYRLTHGANGNLRYQLFSPRFLRGTCQVRQHWRLRKQRKCVMPAAIGIKPTAPTSYYKLWSCPPRGQFLLAAVLKQSAARSRGFGSVEDHDVLQLSSSTESRVMHLHRIHLVSLVKHYISL